MLRELPYSSTERLDGVNGLAYAMQAIATLLVMCDARDLGVSVGENPGVRDQGSGAADAGSSGVPSAVTFEPNIYLYDKYPGGVGLSEPLFRLSDALLENTRKLIERCACPAGCPSCVGPVGDVGEKGRGSRLRS